MPMRLLKGNCILLLLAAVVSIGAGRDVRLAEATKTGDSTAVSALLKQGVDVNAPLNDGATALHWAAYRNDLEVTDLLIRGGARVTAVNDLGVSPLWLAATNGSVALAARLLAAGADPNAAPPTGGTPLMKAVRTGNVSLVKLLIAHGADVNGKEGSRGQTALMYAVALGQPVIVKALLEAHADVHARSVTWPQNFMICCNKGVGEPGHQTLVPRGGYTPLLLAARTGEIESAELLIAAGANVNDVGPEKTSALVVAAFSGQRGFANLLLEHGADPHHALAGYSALHAAVLREDTALTKSLIAHGADPNVRLTEGSPVTRRAGYWAFHRAWAGATPLWIAAGLGNAELMHVLLANGADPSLSANDGTTVLMAAAESISARAIMDGRKRRGPESRQLEAVKAALAMGNDVNAINDVRETALHRAAGSRYVAIIQLLTEKGAAINPRNAHNQTPLDVVLSCRYCLSGGALDIQGALREAAEGREPAAAMLRKIGGTSDNVQGLDKK